MTSYLASIIGYTPPDAEQYVLASGMVFGSDLAKEWAIYVFSHPVEVVNALGEEDKRNLSEFYTSLIPLPWSEEYLLQTYFTYMGDRPFQFVCPWKMEAPSATVLASTVETQLLEQRGSISPAVRDPESALFYQMWEGAHA